MDRKIYKNPENKNSKNCMSFRGIVSFKIISKKEFIYKAQKDPKESNGLSSYPQYPQFCKKKFLRKKI